MGWAEGLPHRDPGLRRQGRLEGRSNPDPGPSGAGLQHCEWDRQREAFGDTVIDTIAEYAPNIRDIILHRQVVTPLDLERDFGLTEGNIFQGELTLEQLFFARPVPGRAQYKTPVQNRGRCGPAPPTGAVSGRPLCNCVSTES